MGHESQIEPWSPIRLTFCFAGFGTDRLRCQRVMKTAGTENPNRWVLTPGNRALGAEGQNRSCSSKWAAKEENFQPRDRCFFLTFPFIEQTRRHRLKPDAAEGSESRAVQRRQATLHRTSRCCPEP